MGSPLITLDTSGIFALVVRDEPDHDRTLDALAADAGPYLVPAGILAEVGYVLERWVGSPALEAFLEDLESAAFTLDCGEDDFPRIRELVRRYDDLPLGFADASVVACAERHGGRVLTLDRRDFDVVARETKLELLPAPPS